MESHPFVPPDAGATAFQLQVALLSGPLQDASDMSGDQRLNVPLGCSKTPFFGIFLELLLLHCVWGVCQGGARFGPRRTFSEPERLALWRPRRARGVLPLTHYSVTTNWVSKYWRP